MIKWADVCEDGNIDLENVKDLITEKTNILCIVHWGGNPVDLDKIEFLKIYTKNKFGTNLKVIEDCSHAFGAEWKGKKLGTHGNNIAVYSLQAIKHLTTVDGGLLFLPNEELYNRARLLRWYGINRVVTNPCSKNVDERLEQDIPEYGYKFNMNDLNATIGISNLQYIDVNIQKHIDNARFLDMELQELKFINFTKVNKKAKSSYWIYTLTTLHKQLFMKYMIDKGIQVSQVHKRNDINSCVDKSIKHDKLFGVDKIDTQMVCIPVGWWITKPELEYIVSTIKNFYYVEGLLEKDLEEYKKLLIEMNGFKGKINQNFKPDGIFVLKIDNKIVSTGKILIENKLYDSIARIEDVVTYTKYRNMGCASSIISHLIDIAKGEKCYKIILNCSDDIQNFYMKNKFKTEGYQMVLRLE